MQQIDSGNIRNIAFVSHSGAGKTSLAEAILFTAGATTRLGNIGDGTTVSDYDPEEIKRKISINLSLLPCQWKNTKLNIIDTPGYVDFIGEVKEALRVSEAAVITVSGVSGVEVGTEQVWSHVREANLPCFIFINKLDRENIVYQDVLKDVQSKLSPKCLPLVLPIGSQKDFKATIDLITKKGIDSGSEKEVAVPAGMTADIDSYREKLIEAIVEVDDDLLSKYLDGGQINDSDIYRCLKEAIKRGAVFPVFFGSALTNVGIRPLLNAASDYFPSPIDIGDFKAINATNNTEESVKPAATSPLSVLVFKTFTDARIGRISYLRVFSGTITSNSQVWNVNKGAIERIGQLFMLRGKTQEPVNQLSVGDIGAVAKLSATTTGDTLGVKEHPLKLAGIEFPVPALNMAITPKSRDDLDKMGTALPKICEEDFTLTVHRDTDVGDLIISGIGETHLSVAAERLAQRFSVAVALETPRIAYKETITTAVKAEFKHKKQTGGHGQYGHVLIELEPMERGGGFEFVNKIIGGAIPKNYIPAVEKGINEGINEGILAGYPIVDVRVKLYDGSFHPVDSSEMAFKIASAGALKKGLTDGHSVLLEPIVNLSVTVPDSFTGDIISDLNTKRGRVLGMNPSGNGMNLIEAQVPAAEISRYAIDLRSITQGRGTFATKFSHYEEVPALVAQKVIAQKGSAAKPG
ncbi:MAG TPA: elongation factor G [Dehalococcoidia bacterium]|nr:elongation factor G [Dehalococcoidia bacterium]